MKKSLQYENEALGREIKGKGARGGGRGREQSLVISRFFFLKACGHIRTTLYLQMRMKHEHKRPSLSRQEKALVHRTRVIQQLVEVRRGRGACRSVLRRPQISVFQLQNSIHPTPHAPKPHRARTGIKRREKNKQTTNMGEIIFLIIAAGHSEPRPD